MSIAGNPWWTTDIGGFHGGNINNPEFRELMIRWFQYATFSPILRMHGDRQPHKKRLDQMVEANVKVVQIMRYGRMVKRLKRYL